MEGQDIGCLIIGQTCGDREGMRVCYADDANRRGVLASKRKDGGEGMGRFGDMIKFVEDNETGQVRQYAWNDAKGSSTIFVLVWLVSCLGVACPLPLRL